MSGKSAMFRFYAELNDFLPTARRGRRFAVAFDGTPGIKDVIESLGIPHTEIDLILVDNEPVGFQYRLTEGNEVAVFPAYELLGKEQPPPLRPDLPETLAFVCDVHLGRLARCLRMLGFDVAYRNDFSDAEIVKLAKQEGRVILTRDRGLLKQGA
jgi:uncharacterized protein